jgi:hypothetical protein
VHFSGEFDYVMSISLGMDANAGRQRDESAGSMQDYPHNGHADD